MTLLYARPPFEQLKAGAYDLAIFDPPWPNYNRSPKGEKKSSVAKYGRMSFEAIEALPARDIMKRDSVVVLCCTWPLLLNGGDVMKHYTGHDAGSSRPGRCLKAWGCRYSTGGVWRKTTKTGKLARGTGYRLWSSCEPFLIGIIGAPKTVAQPNIFDGLRREHSAKPEELYAWCEAFMPGAKKIEVFSRRSRVGWDTYGYEAGKFDPVVTLQTPANAERPAA